MKMKIIVSILILTTILFAGCVEEERPAEEIEEEIPEEEIPEEEIEEEIPEEEVEEEIPEEEIEEEIPEEEVEEEIPEVEPRSYRVYLDNFLFIPNTLEINRGDTVFWLNFQDDPIRLFTLVSEDGLWEDAPIPYRKSFNYTFNETGTYNITTVEFPTRMKGTIIVK